ncbi:MAG: tRNA threonylcarbamoyladenosine dehydratase [Lachnospiraceae bacterium]|nr:tRNA threonylcarbamoyladenosine dehydratase [Lachnospiraceae bacterium]
MKEQFVRTEMILGAQALEKLALAKVAVFGIGGVGGYVCEALVRSGIENFTLIDKDRISASNINRQIIADLETIGRYKTEVMKERMQKINKEVKVEIRNEFFLPDNAEGFDFGKYDYVVDAVDTVTAKLEIITRSKLAGKPVISAMGAGNKLDATKFRVADIYETKVCPLARVMRRELKKRNIEALKVVYSEEEPVVIKDINGLLLSEMNRDKSNDITESEKFRIPGSVAFVPSVAGLIIAGEVVKDLIK